MASNNLYTTITPNPLTQSNDNHSSQIFNNLTGKKIRLSETARADRKKRIIMLAIATAQMDSDLVPYILVLKFNKEPKINYANSLNMRNFEDPSFFNSYYNQLKKKTEKLGFNLKGIRSNELGEQGNNPHIHMIVWIPSQYTMHENIFIDLWRAGDAFFEECESPEAHGSYISKHEPKAVFPKGMRTYQLIGFTKEEKEHINYKKSPYWIQRLVSEEDGIKKVKDGYINVATGVFFESPYLLMKNGKHLWLVEKQPHQYKYPKAATDRLADSTWSH